MLLKMAAGDKAGPRQECASSLQFYGSRRLKDEKRDFCATGVIGRGKKEEGESCSEVSKVWGELLHLIEGPARAAINNNPNH